MNQELWKYSVKEIITGYKKKLFDCIELTNSIIHQIKKLNKKINANKKNTSFLEEINFPKDLKKLKEKDLSHLCNEVREFMIDKVSKTGGHLGAGLGVVELTVAIHYIFNTPKDKIIWDVGHQSYPHKILTGRKNRMHTLRKGNGLSGFTKRSESIYDAFGAAHASTSISAIHKFFQSLIFTKTVSYG